MATPVLMPLMGMTMEEGIVSSWLVEDGATVTKGQPILEFETDKINATVEAPEDGVLGGIAAQPGDAGHEHHDPQPGGHAPVEAALEQVERQRGGDDEADPDPDRPVRQPIADLVALAYLARAGELNRNVAHGGA